MFYRATAIQTREVVTIKTLDPRITDSPLHNLLENQESKVHWAFDDLICEDDRRICKCNDIERTTVLCDIILRLLESDTPAKLCLNNKYIKAT